MLRHLRRHAHRLGVLRAGALRPHRAVRGRPAAAVHRGVAPERRRATPPTSTTSTAGGSSSTTTTTRQNASCRRSAVRRRQPVRLPSAGQRRLLGRHPGHRLLPRRRPGQRPDRRPALVLPGLPAPDTWRIRPTAATPAAFTVANPRPATPPAVGGAIKAVSMNLLNYFTTIDTTSSTSSGPCAPVGDPGLPRRRQRRRAQPPARAGRRS